MVVWSFNHRFGHLSVLGLVLFILDNVMTWNVFRITTHCEASLLVTLQWRHNQRDGVSNHQPRDCLLNHLFRRRSKKTSKHRVTGLCAGNSPGTGEFPAQMASYAENVSIWWRHHDRGLSEAKQSWKCHKEVPKCVTDADLSFENCIKINWKTSLLWRCFVRTGFMYTCGSIHMDIQQSIGFRLAIQRWLRARLQ